MPSFRYLDVDGDPLSTDPLTILGQGVATIVDDDANLEGTDGSAQFEIGGASFNNTAFGGETYTATLGGSTVSFIYLTSGPDRIVMLEGTINPGDVLTDVTRVSFTAFSPYEDLDGFVCFAAGTLVETAKGLRLVEDLRPGDLVQTRDNGLQMIQWVGSKRLTIPDLIRCPNFRPFRIRKNSLGTGWPDRDLVVSPEHRILLLGWRSEVLTGYPETLAAAADLRSWEGIAQDMVMQEVTYVHFLFERHEIVLSNGIWTESFHPDDHALDLLGSKQREGLFEVVPELKATGHAAHIAHARPILKRHEASLVANVL